MSGPPRLVCRRVRFGVHLQAHVARPGHVFLGDPARAFAVTGLDRFDELPMLVQDGRPTVVVGEGGFAIADQVSVQAAQ